jgi:uncharacterized protein YkwD
MTHFGPLIVALTAVALAACDGVGYIQQKVGPAPAIRMAPSGDETPTGLTVGEGQDCSARACAYGLVCSGVYGSATGTLLGKFCFQRCRGAGDPLCDGDEVCTATKKLGNICFTAGNPAGGYTGKNPSSQNPAPPDPTPPTDPDNPTTPPDPTPPQPQPQPSGACGNAEESAVFALLNQQRTSYGLAALSCDLKAVAVARAYSEVMCQYGMLDHTGPDGSQPWDRLQAGGVFFASAGENIAMGYETPEDVTWGWMESPGHRDNMLSADWTSVGIGYAPCGGSPYWTEDFMN